MVQHEKRPGDDFFNGGARGGGGRLRETCEGLDKGNRGSSVPNKRPVGVKRIRPPFGGHLVKVEFCKGD